MKHYLIEAGVVTEGADEDHGGFLTIKHSDAANVAHRLAAEGVHADARGNCLRLSPDCLTLDEEMRGAAHLIASAIGRTAE
jgi:kynureninase